MGWLITVGIGVVCGLYYIGAAVHGVALQMRLMRLYFKEQDEGREEELGEEIFDSSNQSMLTSGYVEGDDCPRCEFGRLEVATGEQLRCPSCGVTMMV